MCGLFTSSFKAFVHVQQDGTCGESGSLDRRHGIAAFRLKIADSS